MIQVTESTLSILDPYGPYSESQCSSCENLIDGHCDMVCKKYQEIPMDIWNNERTCSDKVVSISE